ncbi:MAG: hypothetical protein CM1200mP41_19860 [Gammaproteobacteria bacterium]|nr:MAG: hypothetical protein CM1200mP41_19860 [Gammaproteobacteria bacterium]
MNNAKHKVLVANLRSLGEVFNITPEVFRTVGTRYRQLADKLESLMTMILNVTTP